MFDLVCVTRVETDLGHGVTCSQFQAGCRHILNVIEAIVYIWP